LKDFAGYQVTNELLKRGGAASDALFMHCLPRHNGPFPVRVRCQEEWAKTKLRKSGTDRFSASWKTTDCKWKV
jgi:ornithine carbamoyltransferase